MKVNDRGTMKWTSIMLPEYYFMLKMPSIGQTLLYQWFVTL